MLLCAAAEAGDIERVQTLTARGVDVNAKDRSTLTPLHYAARRGHKEIIELLRKYAKPVPQAR
jgi:ankyrin repeat protein